MVTIGDIANLSDLPEGVFGHNLIALPTGEIMQLGTTGDWRINYLAPGSQWQYHTFWYEFDKLSYFSSVQQKNSGVHHIYKNSSYNIGPSGATERHGLPFEAPHGHCAVSNGNHVVFIGAGEKRNEIWIGSLRRGSRNNFFLMNVLPFGRRDHKCLWVGTKIFVTGGNVGTLEKPDFINRVDIIDTLNGLVKSEGHLLTRRANHGMIFWHGRPIVIGGQIMVEGSTSPTLAITDEYFDETSLSWKDYMTPFALNRHSFGLVQFLAVKNSPNRNHPLSY